MANRKKLIDENGRLFGRISVIDVFVLIVVAVMAVAVYMKFNAPSIAGPTVNTIPVTYDVELKSVRLTAVDALRAGDTVYADGGYLIGTVAGITVKEATTPSTLQDGTYIIATVEGKYDVTVTIAVDCSVSNGRLYANKNYELGQSAEVKLYTKYYAASGVVMRIEKQA